MLNGFTFDGINSLDYGFYISSASVYDAPNRVVEMTDVPGKNGALAIDTGRFENIEVKYHVYSACDTQEEFSENIQAFRNAVCSRYDYVRLTDDYNAGEYRLALYKDGLSVNAPIDRYGGFDVVFECKPQRFLTSGETARSIPEWSDMHTDSGSLVTIDNSSGEYAVKSLSTYIVPQQDLNGYDHPWAGGAGKNKFPVLSATQTISGVTATKNSDGSITLSGTATATLYFDVDTNFNTTAVAGYYFSGIPSPCPYGNGVRFRICNSTSDRTALNDYYVSTSGVVTGGVINDNGSGKCLSIRVASGTAITTPLKLYPMISAVQDDTFAPYENICPITGFSSTNVYSSGKNMLRHVYPSETKNGVTFTENANGTVSTSGTATANAEHSLTWRVAGQYGTCFLKAGTYILSGCPSGGGSTKYEIGINTTVNGSGVTLARDYGNGATFTMQNDGYVGTWVTIRNGQNASGLTFKPMIEQGSTATAYEKYNGNTYSVSFGSAGTVYGGTLDVVSGQLTVTYKIISENDFYAVSSGTSGGGLHYANVNSSGYPAATSSNSLSNMLVNNQSGWGSTTPCYTTNTSGNPVRVYGVFTTLAEFKTAYEGLQIVYELATPLTYQLTATQVAFLLGTNNIWSDTGDIQIEYGKGGNTLYNPTLFDSLPLIKVTGTGTLGVGSWIITITGTSGQIIYIDCDIMDAYKITGGIIESANNLVSFNKIDYPRLVSGLNNFSVGTGITEVKVIPRWWRV